MSNKAEIDAEVLRKTNRIIKRAAGVIPLLPKIAFYIAEQKSLGVAHPTKSHFFVEGYNNHTVDKAWKLYFDMQDSKTPVEVAAQFLSCKKST